MTNKIILMIGGPATGKTTVGKILAKHFGLPFFSKDGVKEPIFDYVGCPTSIENESPLSGAKMDDAARAILFHLLEMQISANKGCLFDSTFGKSHVEELNRSFYMPNRFFLVCEILASCYLVCSPCALL